MAIYCSKCNTPAEIRDTTQCSVCSNRYHFDCSGLSEKLYQLMTAEKKKQWRCRVCITQKGKSETKKSQQNIISHQNVTTRKKRASPKKNSTPCNIDPTQLKPTTITSCSLDSSFLSEGNTCNEFFSPDLLSKSVEERLCISSIQDLKHQITTLNFELMTTQNELENTICENNELKRTIGKLTQEVTVLKTICSSPALITNNSSTPRKKRTSVISQDEIGSKTPQKPITTRDCSLEIEKIKLEKKMCDLQNQLSQAVKEIVELKNIIDTLELKLYQCPTNPIHLKPSGSINSQTKSKLCIISTNKINKILTVAENTFDQKKYDLCHYLMPNRGIQKLLEDIELKIVDFTMNDFCVILLGDEDFNTSKNYQDLVSLIRNTLQKIQSTNIVICSPIFHCARYANVFNWRIEHFNKLLNEDVNKYEYAYLIDSNYNLECDETMFHTRKGTVKNLGMRVVLRDVHKKITDIEDWNYFNINPDNENYVNNNSQSFFRPSNC